jgi:hypothetical protein
MPHWTVNTTELASEWLRDIGPYLAHSGHSIVATEKIDDYWEVIL